MKNEIQCLDLVMWKVSKDPTPLVCPPRNDQPTPHVLSPEGGNSAPADLSLPNIQIDDDDRVRVLMFNPVRIKLGLFLMLVYLLRRYVLARIIQVSRFGKYFHSVRFDPLFHLLVPTYFFLFMNEMQEMPLIM